MDNAQVGEGDVEISLLMVGSDEPETLWLRPSYQAATTISRLYGGLTAAIERIAKLDADVINQVIKLGLGYGGGPARKAPSDLDDRIWRTGYTDDTGQLAERCITYLGILANAGRRLKGAAGDGGDGTPRMKKES